MNLRQVFRIFKAPCISQRLFEIAQVQVTHELMTAENFSLKHTAQVFPSAYL